MKVNNNYSMDYNNKILQAILTIVMATAIVMVMRKILEIL